ncbi:MAG TPA: response regulator [Candidatus Didemnitutus sp.]|nr:response regulator [Candidatus Didemnitutus sp.]
MATSTSTATEARPQSTVATGKCVMLVDDETAYIDLLEQLLGEHLSCPVHCFTRPIEALRALPTLDVGLIVTDYQMPGLDGLEFIGEVQRRKPGIPAVMITAYQIKFTDQQMNRVPTLKAVVRKPFKWTALAEHISRYWNGSTPPFPMGSAGE